MTLPIPGGSSTPQKKPKSKDEKVAHGVEVGAKTVASGIGTAFGASKLRDAYRDDLQAKQGKRKGNKAFNRQVDHGEKRVARVAGPKVAAKGAQLARTGRPNFKHLVTLVGAGSVATGAGRYQKAEQYIRDHRKTKGGTVTKAVIVKASPGYEGARRAEGGNPFRVQALPGKHAPKPYAGKRRKLSTGDRIRVQSMIHGSKIMRAVEGAVDLYKADTRVDGRATLTATTLREITVSKSAFGVEGVEIIKAGTHAAGRVGQAARDAKDLVGGMRQLGAEGTARWAAKGASNQAKIVGSSLKTAKEYGPGKVAAASWKQAKPGTKTATKVAAAGGAGAAAGGGAFGVTRRKNDD